jgi:hypothetical protein
MNDVYAGDDDLPSGTVSLQVADAFVFHVVADSDADVLLRVASLLLLSNRAPFRLTLTQPSPDTVLIEAHLRGITRTTAESIRRKLQQLSCTETVELADAPEPFR